MSGKIKNIHDLKLLKKSRKTILKNILSALRMKWPCPADQLFIIDTDEYRQLKSPEAEK